MVNNTIWLLSSKRFQASAFPKQTLLLWDSWRALWRSKFKDSRGPRYCSVRDFFLAVACKSAAVHSIGDCATHECSVSLLLSGLLKGTYLCSPNLTICIMLPFQAKINHRSPCPCWEQLLPDKKFKGHISGQGWLSSGLNKEPRGCRAALASTLNQDQNNHQS